MEVYGRGFIMNMITADICQRICRAHIVCVPSLTTGLEFWQTCQWWIVGLQLEMGTSHPHPIPPKRNPAPNQNPTNTWEFCPAPLDYNIYQKINSP